jgi:hypothetical protein
VTFEFIALRRIIFKVRLQVRGTGIEIHHQIVEATIFSADINALIALNCGLHIEKEVPLNASIALYRLVALLL